AAASSAMAVRYRPHGSTPTLSKMKMLSGAPVNLKKSVCRRITAATMRTIQSSAFIVSISEVEVADRVRSAHRVRKTRAQRNGPGPESVGPGDSGRAVKVDPQRRPPGHLRAEAQAVGVPV